MLLFYLCIVLLASAYFFLILYFISAWQKGKTFASGNKPSRVFVSIILPVRNEEKNIEPVLSDLLAQEYPPHLFEIITADDGSEDATAEKIHKLQAVHSNLKYLHVKNPTGKKNAVAEAVRQSAGDLIITTDADCRIGKKWLSAIASYYEEKRPAMIIGPVIFHREKSVFHKMQSLEFLSLASVTAASALSGNPLLCSGANLCYTKQAFLHAGGFSGNENIPSGDDMFLLMKFKKLFPGKIRFLKSREAIVYTLPQNSFGNFIEQRKRWTSKNHKHQDVFTSLVSWLVLLFNAAIVVLFLPAIQIKSFTALLALALLSKITIDFLFLFLTASWFNKKKLLWLYFPVQVLNLFYIPFIAIAGLLGHYNWKGRRYSAHLPKEKKHV